MFTHHSGVRKTPSFVTQSSAKQAWNRHGVDTPTRTLQLKKVLVLLYSNDCSEKAAVLLTKQVRNVSFVWQIFSKKRWILRIRPGHECRANASARIKLNNSRRHLQAGTNKDGASAKAKRCAPFICNGPAVFSQDEKDLARIKAVLNNIDVLIRHAMRCLLCFYLRWRTLLLASSQVSCVIRHLSASGTHCWHVRCRPAKPRLADGE